MMVQKPSKVQPAVVGGLILGLLSAIPVVNFANICCCLWVVIGGMIGARMLINRSPVLPITTGDGAATGALAGVVGALVNLVIGVPISLMMGNAMMVGLLRWFGNIANSPEARDQIENTIRQLEQESGTESAAARLMTALFFWLIGAAVTVAFASLGGILGVALFEKRKGQSAPPMAPPGPGFSPGFSPGPPPAGPAV
jgi:hypothetical protein